MMTMMTMMAVTCVSELNAVRQKNAVLERDFIKAQKVPLFPAAPRARLRPAHALLLPSSSSSPGSQQEQESSGEFCFLAGFSVLLASSGKANAAAAAAGGGGAAGRERDASGEAAQSGGRLPAAEQHADERTVQGPLSSSSCRPS